VNDDTNGRVLGFPQPFAKNESATQVIGQPNLTTGTSVAGNFNATQSDLYGNDAIAFDPSGNLWVSDGLNNRVLEFPAATTGSSSSASSTESTISSSSSTTSSTTVFSSSNFHEPLECEKTQEAAVMTRAIPIIEEKWNDASDWVDLLSSLTISPNFATTKPSQTVYASIICLVNR
jgi:hypothetical protein